MGKTAKVNGLSEEQKAAVVNAVFERVRVIDLGKRFMYSLLTPVAPILILVGNTEDVASWIMNAAYAVLLMSFCISVFFLYKLMGHLFSFVRRRNIAKSIGCNPDEFSNSDVLLYILKPMLDEGKWQHDVGEQFKA